MEKFLMFLFLLQAWEVRSDDLLQTTVTTIPVKPLEGELKDIIALIPQDTIRNIALNHSETDEEFKAAINYMQSNEWIDLIETIKAKPEWIALKDFLKKLGIRVDKAEECIRKFITSMNVTLDENLPPPKKNFGKFIADVGEQIPSIKILTLLHEKMTKCENFQRMYENLSSKESRKLLEDVIVLPEVKRYLKEMTEMGVNLEDILSLMYTFFGWGELKVSP